MNVISQGTFVITVLSENGLALFRPHAFLSQCLTQKGRFISEQLQTHQVKSMGLVEHQMTFSLVLTLKRTGMQVGCRPMMTLINFHINMQLNLN